MESKKNACISGTILKCGDDGEVNIVQVKVHKPSIKEKYLQKTIIILCRGKAVF